MFIVKPVESCKTEVLNVVQEETFAGKSYERRHEEEEGELAQIVGNKAPRLLDPLISINLFRF